MFRIREAIGGAMVVVVVLSASLAWGATNDAEPPRVAFLVRADNPVDAFAASAIAAQLGGVVLLTDQDRLSEAATAGLRTSEPDLVVLSGGTEALAETVRMDVEALGLEVRRIGGETRQDTAQQIAALLEELGIGRPLLSGVPISGGVDFGGARVTGLPFVTQVTFLSSPLAPPSACVDDWRIPDAGIDNECQPTGPNNPDRHFFTQRIDGADLPPDASAHMEYRGKADGGNTVCARLFDLTTDAPVVGSDACATISGDQKTFSMTSSPFTLPHGPHDYVVELRTQGPRIGHASVGVITLMVTRT